MIPWMESVRAHGWAKVEQCRTIPWKESVESRQERRPSNCREQRREQVVEGIYYQLEFSFNHFSLRDKLIKLINSAPSPSGRG